MKKIGIAILLLLLVSCKTSNKIIEDFLVEETKNNKIINTVLIDEKIAFPYSMTAFVSTKITQTPSERLTYEYLNNKYRSTINEEYMFNGEKWRDTDFKKINLDIVSQYSLQEYRKSNPSKAENSSLFSISNPYFYKESNSKFVFFCVIFRKKIFDRNPTYDEAIIFKKIKGKWTFVERRTNNSLY